MSPQELAAKHPVLYHVTRPQAVPGIRRHGILSTSRLLDLFEAPDDERARVETCRRSSSILLSHSLHGTVTLTDNIPLSEVALEKCLDDGLKPADWLRTLNRRVFFWADRTNLTNHLGASTGRGHKCTVLVVDTLRLAATHMEKIELSAINSGSTIRRPARRGLLTFTPAGRYSYAEWQQLRGGRDRIKEITVVDGIPDVATYVIDQYDVHA